MQFFLDSLNGGNFTWERTLACALASELAYSRQSTITSVCRNQWGFEQCGIIDKGSTQLFIAESDAAILVAFRGSSNFDDWIANLKISSSTRDYGLVHSGFVGGFDIVKDAIVEELSKHDLTQRQINLTGHSLGGSLACICRLELEDLFTTAKGVNVVTYGQPRTGDTAYAESINQLASTNYQRFVFGEDLVSRIPPGFRHAGVRYHIDHGGMIEESDSPMVEAVDQEMPSLPADEFKELTRTARLSRKASIDSQVEGVFGSVLETLFPSIRDHRISGYINTIRHLRQENERERREASGLESAKFAEFVQVDSSIIIEQAIRSSELKLKSKAINLKHESSKTPVLVRVSGKWKPRGGLKVDARFGDIVSLMADAKQLDQLREDPNVVRIESSREGGSRECDRSIPFVKADVAHSPPLDERGDLCLVGTIDTGIDVLHKAFREIDDENKCRIWGVWDQRNGSGPTPHAVDNRFTQDYGTYYPAATIQEFVDGTSATPHALRDPQRHGTHVASIAAGRPSGGFAGGVAPESGIFAVIPSMVTEPGLPRSLGYSKSHVDALHFLKKAAELENMPIAINVSLGMNAGPHDGSSLLETSFDQATNLGREPGIVIIKSAGNERGHQGHASVNASQGALREIEWESTGALRDEDYIECWYSYMDELEFTLVDPSGNRSAVVDNASTVSEGTLGGNYYRLRLEPVHVDNGQSQLEITIMEDADEIQIGTWKLEIVGQVVNSNTGRVDAWVERDRARAVKFTTGDNDEMTLSVPGTANFVLTVSACQAQTPLVLTDSSSLGLTRDGRFKPDICAPGQDITAAAAATGNHDEVVTDTGTSMAAPHVTGAMSLAMSKRSKNPVANQLNARQLTTKLVQSCNNINHNDGFGFGILNTEEFLNRI